MNEIRLNSDYLVTVHNDLVDAKFLEPLSVNEQKILLAVLSNIQPSKEQVNTIEPFRIPIKELTSFLGIKDPNYTYFKSVVKKLMQKIIEIRQKDGSWELFHWVSKSSYINSTGIAEIKISDELLPYLVNLDKNFTKIELGVLLNFKRTYSFRLYQLIKKWSNLGKWAIEIENLKLLLGVPKGKLERYNHFKTRALQPSLIEINKYSAFDVSVDEHKTGRRITSLSFKIRNKSTLNINNDNSGQKKKEKEKRYAEHFLSKYEYSHTHRKYIDKKTKQPMLFDGRERIKVILLNNRYDKISDRALFKMEDILNKIIDIHEFNISKEVRTLFSYTKESESIKDHNAFIISTLMKLSKEVLKGNTSVAISDVITMRDYTPESYPDWWIESEKSKKYEDDKKALERSITKLDGFNITVFDAMHLKWVSESKMYDLSDSDTREKLEKQYNLSEYVKLSESGIMNELIENKMNELQSKGYIENKDSYSLKDGILERLIASKSIKSA